MNKPDYSKWELVPDFTAEQAAYLILDLEPRATLKEPMPACVKALRNTIAQEQTGPKPDRDETRIEWREDRFTRNRFTRTGAPPVRQHTIPGEEYYRRETLKSWCEARGRRPAFLYPDKQGLPTGWPYEHETRLLKAVRWAIENYWEGKNQAQGPKKIVVIAELTEKFNLSKNEAEAVDLVTRPDSRRDRRGS